MTKKEIKILQDLEAEHYLLLQEVTHVLGYDSESVTLWRARWSAYNNVLEKLGIESDSKNPSHQKAMELMTKSFFKTEEDV
jgi:predicted nucleic acid-binding protein